ncbi:MAG: DUF1622 domain-containing protein [Pseudomonadota bacterium]
MIERFTPLISNIGFAVEAFGVLVIVLGILQAIAVYGVRYLRRRSEAAVYSGLRRDIGRSLMMGLEFLVAWDIIRTVVIAHSISDVAALGLLVVIRTVLVFTIHLEVEGRWPWQQSDQREQSSGS